MGPNRTTCPAASTAVPVTRGTPAPPEMNQALYPAGSGARGRSWVAESVKVTVVGTDGTRPGSRTVTGNAPGARPSTRKVPSAPTVPTRANPEGSPTDTAPVAAPGTLPVSVRAGRDTAIGSASGGAVAPSTAAVAVVVPQVVIAGSSVVATATRSYAVPAV